MSRTCVVASAILSVGLLIPRLQAQTDYGYRLGTRTGDRLGYQSQGVAIYSEALDPSIGRWYLPAALFSERGRRQWEYTNYVTSRFRREQSPQSEGDFYYDDYGNLITRGWLIYDWRLKQPSITGGSQVKQHPNYIEWFDRLLIASDASGGRGYNVTVGDEIAATLTPMTFRKVGFDGLVGSYRADRFRATGVFSNISDPVQFGTKIANHFTTLMGVRAEADVTDFATVGLTFLNSHDNTARRESFSGNPFKGFLNPQELSQRLELLVVRLSDDSPEDGEGGAVLFSDDIEITTSIMRTLPGSDPPVTVAVDTVILGSSIGFRSEAAGGELVDGFLTANGAETITLRYPLVERPEADVMSLRERLAMLDIPEDERDDMISNIKDVRFRLVLANDYRVEMTSNRQTDQFGLPKFRLVTRADGNVKSGLNQRQVVFDYGLPTANQIVGFTTEIREFHGIDLYGEANLNTQYRKYPAVNLDKHRAISGIEGDTHALGWMVNLSWRGGPWSLFAEGFGMDDGYTTAVQPVRRERGLEGFTNYDPEATHLLYDYVDDNDDNDRHPDQLRRGEGTLIDNPRIVEQLLGAADPEVFPGYDENGDFISDFNQNSLFHRQNFFPDYDEPFLRYRSDRPEFLFGIDLNNNGWAERFENDDRPDYPYRKDHWGYNLYGGVEIIPGAKLRLGQLSQERKKDNRENLTTYGLISVDHDWPWGRVRAFDMLKKVEDTIPDHLTQWVIPRSEFGEAAPTEGRMEPVKDLLAAQDTWINTLYGDYEYSSPRGWGTFHRFKWETWRQRDADVVIDVDEASGDTLSVFDPLGPGNRNGRERSGFTGLINKVEYPHYWGPLRMDARFKSELISDVPFSRDLRKRRSWDAIFFLQAGIPVLRSTRLQAGWEQRFYTDLKGDEDELAAGALTGDFRGSVLALQVSNRSQYLGYNLITQVGVRIDRRSLEVVGRVRDTRTSGLTFLSIYAGLD